MEEAPQRVLVVNTTRAAGLRSASGRSTSKSILVQEGKNQLLIRAKAIKGYILQLPRGWKSRVTTSTRRAYKENRELVISDTLILPCQGRHPSRTSLIHERDISHPQIRGQALQPSLATNIASHRPHLETMINTVGRSFKTSMTSSSCSSSAATEMRRRANYILRRVRARRSQAWMGIQITAPAAYCSKM